MDWKKFYINFRQNRYSNLFVVNLRFLIGFGFLPSGIKKIADTPFAILGNGGSFFNFLDALYHTGIYYNFIGWTQVVAATLLITQRYATLGAFIFFPIILNITVLTFSTIGSLTPLIAASMLFGIVFLMLWDYFKWINIFCPNHKFIYPTKPKNFRDFNSIWNISGLAILCLGILFSLIIENHHHLPSNGATKYIAAIIFITISVPLLTFIIDEYRFRSQNKPF